jgi:hypothetical protein
MIDPTIQQASRRADRQPVIAMRWIVEVSSVLWSCGVGSSSAGAVPTDGEHTTAHAHRGGTQGRSFMTACRLRVLAVLAALALGASTGQATANVPAEIPLRQTHDAAVRLSVSAARLERRANELIATGPASESWRSIVGFASDVEGKMEFLIGEIARLNKAGIGVEIDHLQKTLAVLANEKDELHD